MFDFDGLRKIYKFGKDLQWQEVQVLVKAARRKSYKPGEYLLEAGSTTRQVFFIRKGLVRTYAMDQKGNEITLVLHYENSVLASPDTILFEQPSRYYMQAYEPTQVYSLDYDAIQEIVKGRPVLEHNRKYVLLQMLKDTFMRIESFVMLSPEQRYLQFVADNPTLVNRVPDKFIAHVLGITPVSLSRMRKRIKERGRG